jgi:hypothetical protein
MALQLIKNELFYVEYTEGEKIVQEKFCDSLGHERADHDVQGKKYSIQKGICLRCGEGTRFWKLTEKESKAFKREMESLR